MSITRTNHYVPQGTLRRWAGADGCVDACRLLVARADEQLWKRRGVGGAAQARDLYTLVGEHGGDEADFETFIGQEIESPAYVALDRLIRGWRLTRDDWRVISRFAILQDVRTPLYYIEAKRRWEQEIPAAFRGTLERLPATLAAPQPRRSGGALDEHPNPMAKALHLRIERPNTEHPEEAEVEVSVSSGRRLWIASIQHLVTSMADRIIPTLKWSVVVPADGMEWPLTDSPLLRLNYYSPTRYDFHGGWGRPGTELVLPVSPQHLLYMQVGKRHPARFTFSADHTRLLRRLLVERAFRWVYLTERADWVAKARAREVDAERFAEEGRAFRAWHETHAEREREFHGEGNAQ